MGWIILLILIGGPLLELSVLIDVGTEIGGLNTVLLCILTAAVGLSLVRRQGIAVMTEMRSKMEAGEPTGEAMIHGFFLLLAGLMLMFPGFVSDTFGALLLIPPFRLMLGRAGIAAAVVGGRAHMHKTTTHTHTYRQSGNVYETDETADEKIVDITGVEVPDNPSSLDKPHEGKEKD